MRKERAAAAAVGGMLAVLAAAGCSSGSQAVSLPSKKPASSSPTVSASSNPMQSVIAAYTAFWSAGTTAERSSAAEAETLLAPYAAEPYLGHLLAQMTPYRAKHEEAWGYVTPHVTQVTIKGNGALIRDCQDQSHAALADSQTGQVISDTYGSAHTTYVATLTLGADGRWRVTALEQLATLCEPAPSAS